MLLQRLAELTTRPGFELPPRLYADGPVRYLIELDASGRLLSTEPIDTADSSSPATRRGQRRLVPQVQRTSSVRALLLADKADYVLGYAREGAKPDRVAECHRAFVELIDACAGDTEEPSVLAVQAFLRNEPLTKLHLPDDFDPSAVMTFQVDGAFPIALPAVQAFWAANNDPAQAGAQMQQCLICGQVRPVLERLEAKIKGVPGGQTSGTSIISANAPAFESYGLPASLVAPTCADCSERFTKALNDLLVRSNTHLRLAGIVFAFWTREDVGFDFGRLVSAPEPADVKALFETIRKGSGDGAIRAVDEARFFAVALSASGGRTVVRDWLDTTVGEAKESLRRWFEAQRVTDPANAEPRPLGLYALAAATVRDPQRDLAPPTPRALLRSALTRAPLPTGLLAQAVARSRAEQGMTRPRAALIRLVMRTQNLLQEEELVGLNPEHPSPAYQCGRLLAILEDTQRAAIRGIKATVVDRFYGTASSAPASVFPRLIKGAQPHLAKLERDHPPVNYALQARLRDTLAHLDSFPRTLTLESQGLFALGFYHQHAHHRARAREAAQRRAANQPPTPDEALAEAIDTTADLTKED